MVGDATVRKQGIPHLATAIPKILPLCRWTLITRVQIPASIPDPQLNFSVPDSMLKTGQQQGNLSGLLGEMRSFAQRVVQGLAH